MKEGKWICEGEDRWRCSACEHLFIGFDGIDYTFAYMCNYCPNCGAKMDNTIINNINDDIKTSDDKIIRCKECKWWKKFEQHILPEICSRCGANMSADDFCSRGKRKNPTEF